MASPYDRSRGGFAPLFALMFLLLTMLVSSAEAQTPPEASLKGRVYTNHVHGFYVTLPDKWHTYGKNGAEILRGATAIATGEEESLNQQPTYVLIALDPNPPNPKRSALTLAIEELSGAPKDFSGEDFLRQMESVPTGKSSIDFGPISQETIAGQRFYSRHMGVTVPTGKLSMVLYVGFNNKHAFVFNGAYHSDSQRELILEGIRSIRFLSPES